MEIYVETQPTITVDMPTGFSGVTYALSKGGEIIVPAGNPVTQTSSSVDIKISYGATVGEGAGVLDVKFTLDGNQYTKSTLFDVVTPYLTITESRKVLDDTSQPYEFTDEEITDVEQAVRYIINAHCGQSFGNIVKSQVVVGAGEDALSLPQRLVELTGISTLTSVLNPLAIIIIADGWYLKKRYANPESTSTTDSLYWNGEYAYDYGDEFPLEAPHGLGLTPDRYNHGPVISYPGMHSSKKWKDDYPFTITGTWGYVQVPLAVKESAKLLMNDYACSEQSYRDRYLDSINAADWRLQFNDKAFLQTGNVRADQLLNDYVMKRGWAVI